MHEGTLPARRGLRPARLGRLVAAGPDDALRVAGELRAAGFLVALEHVPAGSPDDAAGELAALAREVPAAGLAGSCELTVPVAHLGAAAARTVVAAAAQAGVAVVLAGPEEVVGQLQVPGAGIVIPASEPGAEERCRALADGRVRLASGRGAAADLAFVRCLNVLMAGPGRPAVATTDARLIAIAGERAAWNDRPPESWEHVMPYGVREGEQQRLLAAGHRVRVAVPSGAGALAVVARRLVGRW